MSAKDPKTPAKKRNVRKPVAAETLPVRPLHAEDDIPEDETELDDEILSMDRLKLSRDLLEAVDSMTAGQARFLVDLYYTMQDNRIRALHQIKSSSRREKPEPHAVLDWIFDRNERLEGQAAAALSRYANNSLLGRWALAQVGIGPIIAAALLAFFDITHAPTAGHWWAFSGQDPTRKWEKGKKRPWNARLKTIVWKIGQSFVKTCNLDTAFYGKVYLKRKAQEVEYNLAGKFVAQAKERISGDRAVGKDTDQWPWNAGCYTSSVARRWYLIEAEVLAQHPELVIKPGDEIKDPVTKKTKAAEKGRTVTQLINEARAALLEQNHGEPGTGVHMLSPGHIQARSARYAAKMFIGHYHEAAYLIHYGKLPPAPYPVAILGHTHQSLAPHMDMVPGWVEGRAAAGPIAGQVPGGYKN
jgi:hypothetical protein